MRALNVLCCITTIAVCLAPEASNGAQAIIKINDLFKVSENTYEVNGKDPYLVFKSRQDDRAHYQLPIQLSYLPALINPADNASTDTGKNISQVVQFELFFNAIANTKEYVFDPLYRLQFSTTRGAPQKNVSGLNLMLPDNVQLSRDQLLRFDIDNCDGCQLTFTTSSNTDVESTGLILKPHTVFNGLHTITDEGINLNIEDWKLHDLSSASETYTLITNGDDPHVISPMLNVLAESLGGVLFDIMPGDSAGEDGYIDYQFFYATNQHGFRQAASSIIQINDNDTSDDGSIRFFIPLNFLSEQTPAIHVLERIRLDLDSIPAIENAKWTVKNVSLINKAQASNYHNVTPTRLVHAKLQRANARQIMKNIFGKLMTDPGFVLGYLLLITITAIGFYKAYRR